MADVLDKPQCPHGDLPEKGCPQCCRELAAKAEECLQIPGFIVIPLLRRRAERAAALWRYFALKSAGAPAVHPDQRISEDGTVYFVPWVE
jgi:hypothetical protein